MILGKLLEGEFVCGLLIRSIELMACPHPALLSMNDSNERLTPVWRLR